jgi:hypothetical protein
MSLDFGWWPRQGRGFFVFGRQETRSKTYVAHIEERFIAQEARDGAEYLSAQDDAFPGGGREEKAPACSARNDRIRLGAQALTCLGVRIQGTRYAEFASTQTC